MGLKDAFNSVFHRKAPGASEARSEQLPDFSSEWDEETGESAFEAPPDNQMPDFYSGIKKADEDLYTAAMHLKSLADDILAESANPNPDATAVKTEYTDYCNKVATDWINSNYTIHSFLADSYGKTWLTENSKEMFESVCKASVISDPQVKASLKEAMSLIAIAGAAIILHGFFTMAQSPDAPTATRNAVEATAAAKTYILGL